MHLLSTFQLLNKKWYLEKLYVSRHYNLVGNNRKPIVRFTHRHTTQTPNLQTQQQRQQKQRQHQQRHKKKLLSPYFRTTILFSSNFLSRSLYENRVPVEKQKLLNNFCYQTGRKVLLFDHRYYSSYFINLQTILQVTENPKFSLYNFNCQKIKTRNMVWPTGHDSHSGEVLLVVDFHYFCVPVFAFIF